MRGVGYGCIHNYYSTHDDILELTNKCGDTYLGPPPFRRNAIEAAAPDIVNHDLTDLVGGHNEYRGTAAEFLVM